MKKRILSLLSILVFVLVGASWVVAQEAEKPAESSAGEKTAAAGKKAKSEKGASYASAATEELSGTITMVDADKKLVVVKDSSGTPFNFKVTGATRIQVAGAKAKLADLVTQTNKQASVKFASLRRGGDVAKSIEVSP